MDFCSQCGTQAERKVPAGDNRERVVCPACGFIDYQNPRIVLGCVPEWGTQVLLCRRAIEPRHGYWTLPAGFMELTETMAEGAARETREEALAEVDIGDLLALVDVPQAHQVHVFFRAAMRNEAHAPGVESLETHLFDEADVPWQDIAFPSVTYALRRYFEDRARGLREVHMTAIGPMRRA